MNKIKVLAITACLILLASLTVRTETVALARHSDAKIHFSFTRLETLDAGRIWLDQGVLHIRNRIDIGALTGDITGMARVVYNADLPVNLVESTGAMVPVPSDGFAYGTIEIFDDSIEPVAPSWLGTWGYRLYSGSVVSGSLQATYFNGSQVMYISEVKEERDGSISHTGRIEHIYCTDDWCLGPGLD